MTDQTPKIAKGITQDMLVSVYKPIGTGENSEVFAGTIADLKEALGIEPSGTGITAVTSTDGSIDIDNTDPSAPDLSIADYAIPLAGTESGNPITGDLQVKDLDGESFKLFYNDNNAEENGLYFETQDQTSELVKVGLVSNSSDGTQVINGVGNSVSFIRVINSSNEATSITSSDGQISLLVRDVEILRVSVNSVGVFDKATSPSSQAAAIADATNATDVITQLNTLLAAMRAYGLIAE